MIPSRETEVGIKLFNARMDLQKLLEKGERTAEHIEWFNSFSQKELDTLRLFVVSLELESSPINSLRAEALLEGTLTYTNPVRTPLESSDEEADSMPTKSETFHRV
jgi:hypothetical protein